MCAIKDRRVPKSLELGIWELTYTTLGKGVEVLGSDGTQKGHGAGENGGGLHFAWRF